MKPTLLLFVTVIFLLSCQKELSQNEIDDNITGRGIAAVSSGLTKGAWTYVSSTLVYSDGEKSEGGGDDCKTDDIYRYETTGFATVQHGPILCFMDPDNGPYATWEILKEGKQLKEVYTRDMGIDQAGSIAIYNIDFLSDSKLIISRTISGPDKTYKEFDTYTR